MRPQAKRVDVLLANKKILEKPMYITKTKLSINAMIAGGLLIAAALFANKKTTINIKTILNPSPISVTVEDYLKKGRYAIKMDSLSGGVYRTRVGEKTLGHSKFVFRFPPGSYGIKNGEIWFAAWVKEPNLVLEYKYDKLCLHPQEEIGVCYAELTDPK